ncbi:response regulator [Rhodovulum sulfidophilum]|uniref:Response regulator n=1 Tax=Rhodovulum sulfidophilum TaxID=35806 RepID=A0ABS1RUC4_RHOSU|nr:response regulator [Rhodovulum sulfidophilum]MBK5922627.1 response regulator [Rhodovulum sulfidophilum]MBL3553532.1 response regulator [Rhodovulum sulfidophilum]MBL3560332.1 response regulator [Rhodovulum sulfidophilum]MBL3564214.1 response regulator [Rhodovulum sulfidophilum]MBL3586261.1 response regulator [Rhodovulum sulfidophilum]
MTHAPHSDDLSRVIGSELPYLRRYARALTGSQTSGDAYAIATLEAILSDREVFEQGLPPKVALFKAFNRIWGSSGAPLSESQPASAIEAQAQTRLAGLTRNTREALLLQSIEGFTTEEVGTIMGLPGTEAEQLIRIARDEMARSIAGRVLIIEDEAIIAIDISAIVQGLGHEVTGIGRTRRGAVDLAKKDPPDLILADIQLADKSSGIDAVNDILGDLGDRPVVFITAFPERLLTGERPEPAFLISKPYTEDQVRSAVSQAMFFSSTETLGA